MLDHFKFMKKAIKQAYKALAANEWPVGAVVVQNNKIIASARNMVETLNNPTMHAEIIAANRALNILNTRYLDKCTLFVTLEPCKMCYFYLETLRIQQIIFGQQNRHYYNTIPTVDCVYETACKQLIDKFSSTLRS